MATAFFCPTNTTSRLPRVTTAFMSVFMSAFMSACISLTPERLERIPLAGDRSNHPLTPAQAGTEGATELDSERGGTGFRLRRIWAYFHHPTQAT